MHTDIVDKQKIPAGWDFCRVTRDRLAVSVLSHATALWSWEPAIEPCFASPIVLFSMMQDWIGA